MNFQERKRIILQTVENQGSVEVKDLAQILNTSGITIRRDLAVLAEKGLIYRTHGGAMKVSLAQDAVSFVNKTAIHSEKKDYICQIAASQIQEGDIIFMDCGSTVFRLCQFIKNKRVKVITNSLPVVYELLNSQVSINLAGGEIDAERQAVHGRIAEEHITRYKANKAFIGTDGISLANGLSALSENEAGISKSMAKNATEVFLLCDSGKLEKDKYFQFAPLSIIDTLITDNQVDNFIIDKYRKVGIKTMY